MPAQYSQKSAQLRAARQAVAGYQNIGADPSDFELVNGLVRSRRLSGPELPTDPPGADGLMWEPQVSEFYLLFRHSPQATLLATDIEWQMVLVAMGLLNEFYQSGSLQAYVKFESLIGQFGVTPASLRRIRVSVVDPDEVDETDAGTVNSEQEAFDQTFDQIVSQA